MRIYTGHRSTRKTNCFGRLRNEWFRSSLGWCKSHIGADFQPTYGVTFIFFRNGLFQSLPASEFLGFGNIFILIIKFCTLRSETPNSEQTVGTSYNKYQLDPPTCHLEKLVVNHQLIPQIHIQNDQFFVAGFPPPQKKKKHHLILIFANLPGRIAAWHLHVQCHHDSAPLTFHQHVRTLVL